MRMIGYDLLVRALDDGEKLRVVKSWFAPEIEGDPLALSLDFDQSSLVVWSDAEHDALIVGETIPSQLGPVTPREHSRELWDRAIGGELAWAWRMSNQQGYEDGLQLEFSWAGSEKTVTVQLLTIASLISVKELV